ncbi:MAG: response regulator transcription factor [Natronospirillum sp.]|uniref:response regulator transcription factor n=1 Tax=Natronospirillum sp. TaxID=2812955 RepID=UPI0025FC6278|nr:response regulator transcription factor [Natronospirillum sp.]MCH8550973.1 response regulator transcription factor [Natronospirillum sp.]
MARFLVADDHPLFREALQGALAKQFAALELREADSLEATLAALEEDDDVDLLLLDLHMPGSGDLYGLIRVREDYPLLPVAIISGSEDPAIMARCIGFGALGFIPKSLPSNQIAEAIQSILDGDTWVPEGVADRLAGLSREDQDLAHKVAELTPQQYRVLCHLHEGLLNKQIAYALGITEATVKAHITAIFRKLDINNRTQAVLMAERLRLTPSET